MPQHGPTPLEKKSNFWSRSRSWMVTRKENEGGGGDHAEEGGDVIPFNGVAQVKNGEDAEDSERNNFLSDFELRRRIDVAAPAIGGNLEDVFEKSDAPACEDDEPDGFAFEFEMTVPGEGHEDVRAGQQDERKKSGLSEIIHFGSAPGNLGETTRAMPETHDLNALVSFIDSVNDPIGTEYNFAQRIAAQFGDSSEQSLPNRSGLRRRGIF